MPGLHSAGPSHQPSPPAPGAYGVNIFGKVRNGTIQLSQTSASDTFSLKSGEQSSSFPEKSGFQKSVGPFLLLLQEPWIAEPVKVGLFLHIHETQCFSIWLVTVSACQSSSCPRIRMGGFLQGLPEELQGSSMPAWPLIPCAATWCFPGTPHNEPLAAPHLKMKKTPFRIDCALVRGASVSFSLLIDGCRELMCDEDWCAPSACTTGQCRGAQAVP